MKTTLTLFLTTLILSLSPVAFADQGKTYYDNVDWAKNTASQTRTKTEYGLNVDDYCADLNCRNKVHNPDESHYNDAAINNNKTTAFHSNESALAVQDGFNKGRPTIDPNEDTYRFALIGQENAYEISHGISSVYADCETGQQCLIDHVDYTCNAPTHKPVICAQTPYVKNTSFDTGSTTAFNTRKAPGVRIKLPEGVTVITRIDFPNTQHTEFTATNAEYKVNGILVGRFALSTPLDCIASVCYFGSRPRSIPMKLPVTDPNIVISTSPRMANGNVTVYWERRTNIIGWHTSCSDLLPECKQTAKRCVAGPATKHFEGISTYLPCWKYETSYQCKRPDTCGTLKNCKYVGATCSLNHQGVCIENQITKKCEEKNCRDTSLVCGDTSFCLDGDCYGGTPDYNTNFDKSAAALAAVSAAGEDLGDPPVMFSGKVMKCTDKALGFANCCKDGGWGTSVGLDECNSEEKALGDAKKRKLTIYVGRYCSKKVLGACLRKKKSYCVFDSKLARIIQEQGAIKQLGKNFGSAKRPNCAAITPEELSQMNFSAIDFSEFYGDMHSNINLPNPNEIKARIEHGLGD